MGLAPFLANDKLSHFAFLEACIVKSNPLYMSNHLSLEMDTFFSLIHYIDWIRSLITSRMSSSKTILSARNHLAPSSPHSSARSFIISTEQTFGTDLDQMAYLALLLLPVFPKKIATW